MNELLGVAALLWLGAGLLGLAGRLVTMARGLLVLGCLSTLAVAVLSLPVGSGVAALPFRIGDEATRFRMTPEALWLFGFGMLPALLACGLGTPARSGRGIWVAGAAASLLGALGVCGVQDGAALLIAWELMSLGGAAMLLAERLGPEAGGPALFMLGLLEVGAVALLLAVLLLGRSGGSLGFDSLAGGGAALGVGMQLLVGLLLLAGFGAKLGLLPFYEWFPEAYSTGSGASGAMLSGPVLNAAFLALSRALVGWLPDRGGSYDLGMILVLVGVASAVLTILYAFQQSDWRRLLSLSSAENGSLAVVALGAALMFRGDAHPALAAMAWTVALLHLAGHALAKGAMFLTADGVFRATGSYEIRPMSLARRTSWVFGVGALFGAMSLAAMPPQAGFVSEWFLFQTVFQGFNLSGLGGRLVLALAGAALALTAAIAFATFIKAVGLGVFGGRSGPAAPVPRAVVAAVGVLGLCILLLAVGLPLWLPALSGAAVADFGSAAPSAMHDGLLLVPLTASFAFISPTKLVIAVPLLALLPTCMLLVARHATPRLKPRRVPLWAGGAHRLARADTTALTFSNALRTFYSFVYRPTMETTRESSGRAYFVTRVKLSQNVAPLFRPTVFDPLVQAVVWLSGVSRQLQSGHLNRYLGIIGLLLVLVLALTLF